MSKIYKFLLTLAVVCAGLNAEAADGKFTIECNNPDQITVTMKKGYSGSTETIVPEGNVFTLEFENYWDIYITPKDGFHVTSLTGVDGTGANIEKDNAGWKYDNINFSYSIYSSKYGTFLDGYKFKVESDVYVAPQWNISVNVNHPEAFAQGTFKVGKETVTAVQGENKITINPDQGKLFSAILTPSVNAVTLTQNGSVVTPEETYDGRFKYEFDLVENANIVLNATMENPVCYVDCKNAGKIIAYYPDTETSYVLNEGHNELTYTVGSKLRVYAAEGYRLICSDNMSYDSSTKSYVVSFTGGQSGQTYTIEAEEYIEPIAHIILNLTDPTLVTYVGFSPGYNPVRSFKEGDNEYKYNTDEINMMEIDYKAETETDVISACNDQVLTVTKDFYGDFISEIPLKEAGEYWIAVRQRLTGDWAGTATWTRTSNEYEGGRIDFTLDFNPGGVLEIADETQHIELLKGTEKVCELGVLMHHGQLWLSYGDAALTAGKYTVKVPAGMWKVNGALLGEQTFDFDYDGGASGMKDVFSNNLDTKSPVYAIDGRLVAPVATPEVVKSLGRGLYIIGGKKIIVK